MCKLKICSSTEKKLLINTKFTVYKSVVLENMNRNETYSNKIFRDDKN